MGGSFLKGAVVGLVCALIGGATVALAGSGINGVFNLGVSNSVNAKTSLTGSTATPQLQLSNTNTTAGAAGLGVSSASSTSTGSFANSSTGAAVFGTSAGGVGVFAQSGGAGKPALFARSTAGGPAGSFVVNAGVAPFTVNSTTKVVGLNADLLDGLDAAQLQRRVSGSCATGSAIRVVNSNGSVFCQAVGGAGGSWSLTGNAGTSSGANFLGTTDAQPLVLKTAGLERVRVSASGSVGVGTSTPTAKLHVGSGNPGLRVEGPAAPGGTAVSVGGYGAVAVDAPGVAGGRLIVTDDGNVGIGTPSPTDPLTVTATGESDYAAHFSSQNYRGLYVDSAPSWYTAVIQNRGGSSYAGLYLDGSLWVTGSKVGYVVDLAVNEGSEPLETGDVVAITGFDQPVSGEIPVVKVRKATQADSRAVAGVVDQPVTVRPDSEAGGKRIPMPARASAARAAGTAISRGEYVSIATLGAFRAIKVDATTGSIRPGDLLVASDNPGHAMRSDDPRPGSVLGKALGSLDNGTGVIPVMVTLD